LAPVAALLLVALLVLPGPRQVLGNWMASFGLGAVEVVVAPEEIDRPPLALQSKRFDSLDAAAAAVDFTLLQPLHLPTDYDLVGFAVVYAEGLPENLRPLYVETAYRPSAAEPTIQSSAVFRQFNPARPQQAALTELEFQAEVVRNAQNTVLPNGLPAVLVEFEAADGGDTILLRQLIWEQEGRVLELWSEVLPVAEMLSIASSVR
jgi:hypothetical protein